MITKVAYFDCPTGISGDMCLGALVDAGLPLMHLEQALAQLGIAEEYHLRAEFVRRNGQQATKLHVDLADLNSPAVRPHAQADHEQAHQHSYRQAQSHDDHAATPTPAHSHPRRLPEIAALIQNSGLPQRVIQQSVAVFQRLAEAEGAVHGIPPEQVHFHEVGATDAIVDIVGTCIGLDYLGLERLYCSALPVGGGTVWAAHGRLPVPAPAMLKLCEMRQVPLYSNGIERELVTPTGAALVTVLASQFGPPPPMQLQRVGLGAGAKELAIPNILRLWIGEADLPKAMTDPSAMAHPPEQHPPEQHEPEQQLVTVLETQIDDLSPQAIGYVMTELLTAGALDVFTQAIGMKKSRPGILLSVICQPNQVARCESILFQETTTLGIRHSQQQRTALSRSIQVVSTTYGPVQVKVASLLGTITNVQPEYEDCAQLARKHQVPWREIHRLALQAWHIQLGQAQTE